MSTEQTEQARLGGVEGNRRLTSTSATVLIVLLAAEGATLLRIGQLISVHVFVGMLLIPPVTLKLCSTGYRFARYYRADALYRAAGPPPPLMRYVIAPMVVLSTLALFATGVALIVLGRDNAGIVGGLHKASFIFWVGAMTIHVLGHLAKLPTVATADLRRATRIPGTRLRAGLLAAVLIGGIALAVLTLPLATSWVR